jgi:hypothetical protein
MTILQCNAGLIAQPVPEKWRRSIGEKLDERGNALARSWSVPSLVRRLCHRLFSPLPLPLLLPLFAALPDIATAERQSSLRLRTYNAISIRYRTQSHDTAPLAECHHCG